MKILHIISGNLHGGAAKGAYLLHQSLLKMGVESRVLTNTTDTMNDPSVYSINSQRWQRFKNRVIHNIDKAPLRLYPKREKQIFSNGIVGFPFMTHPSYKWADIIHLHWINGGMTNVRHLSAIKKPIVWTMRDMWAMTGGCHYSLTCERYKTGCGKCIQLRSKKSNDLSRFNFDRKLKYLPRKCVYVGISPWLTQTAKESKLLQNSDIRMIFNNVNCSGFFPLNKRESRNALQIETSKKIILIGAQKITDPYKGFDKFIKALSLMDNSKYYILFFGKFDEAHAASLGFEYKCFGFIHDMAALRLLYSAADLFVAPSFMDAFGKTLVESMACGTPVVCFDATGPKDIVDHKKNGYKAAPYDHKDLKRGIEWVAYSKEYEKLSHSAREKAVTTFDNMIIASQYHELYAEMLSFNHAKAIERLSA